LPSKARLEERGERGKKWDEGGKKNVHPRVTKEELVNISDTASKRKTGKGSEELLKK